MRRFSSSILFLSIALLAGCESATEPVNQSPDDVLIEQTAQSLGISRHFNRRRGAHFLVGRATTADGGPERVVEVLALNTRRGVFGRYRVTLPTLDLFFSVDVTCLAVKGRTAWVGGIISETNASFVQVGTVSYFYAVDNQRRHRRGDPDIVSTARFNDIEGEDLAFCADKPLLLAPAEVIDGGVLVR